MTIEELKVKSKEELQKLLITLKDNLTSLRFKHSLKQLKDTSQIKKTKRDIARVLTILNNINNNKFNYGK